MDRKASAVWQGGLKAGKGTLSTDSGVLKQTAYSFHSRFESGIGTNPEELLAAAHAGCFTMALSGQLGKAGMTAKKLETTATISLEKSAKASPSPKAIWISSPKSPVPTKPNSTPPSKPPKPVAPSPSFSKPKSPSTPNSSAERVG